VLLEPGGGGVPGIEAMPGTAWAAIILRFLDIPSASPAATRGKNGLPIKPIFKSRGKL
jgi:hypothetical protein